MKTFYPEFIEKSGVVSITDHNGTIIHVNDKFCEISQHSREELIGQNHSIISSGYHEQSFFAAMWHTISKGTEWRGEICNRAKDGSLYWVDTIIVPQLDENNKPIRYYSLRILITDRKKQELSILEINNELHNKNARLNSILNIQSNLFVMRVNMEGVYTYVNDALVKKLGYALEDFLGKPVSFSIHPDDLGLCQVAAAKAMENTGEPSIISIRKISSWGEIFLSEWHFVAIYDSNGGPIEMQAIGFDITEKSKYMEEINTTKAQMESILSSIDEVIWSCTAEDFKFLYMNQASVKLFGYSPEEFSNDEYLFFNIIVKDDLLRFTQHLKRLKTNGHSVFEYKIRHKNGSIKHIYDRVTKIENNDGTFTLNGVAADLTSLKQFEEKTKHNEKRLIRTFETISGAFFLLNKEWKFEYMSEAAEKLLLKTRAEIMHRSIWEVLPEANDTEFNKKFIDAVLFNKNMHFEQYYEPLNAWFSVSAYPNSEGLAVYFQDITSKKLAEDLLKMQNRKFQEIAWIQSHKVRSPVANILGLLSIMDKTNLANPMNAHALQLLENAAFKLDEIIHEIVNKAQEISTFQDLHKEINLVQTAH